MNKNEQAKNDELIKEQICEIGKRIYAKGMVVANDGNISARLHDDIFICTPTGVSKGYLTPDMLCKVNSKCEMIEPNPKGYKPSSEMKMHLVIFRERADVNAVVHAHPPYATAFAICHKPLDMQIISEATMSLGFVPVAEYAAPSTMQLSESVAPFLQEHDSILLANHGAVSCGADLLSAYYKMESVEYYAKLIYISNNIGTPKVFNNEQIKELIDIRNNHYKIDGKHPGINCLKK